jgi:hypothetical protein
MTGAAEPREEAGVQVVDGRPQDRREPQRRDLDAGVLAREPRGLALGADLVVDEARVRVAAQLGALVEEVGVLGVGAVGQRGRHHHQARRVGGGAGVHDVHRADVLELVGPLGGVGRMRQERAVDHGVDVLAREQGGDLAVDRRLGQIDREEPRLGRARGEQGRRLHVEHQDLGVATIFLEPTQELGAEEGAGAGDRDHPTARTPGGRGGAAADGDGGHRETI